MSEICSCITDLLCCRTETSLNLQINYTPIKTNFKKRITTIYKQYTNTHTHRTLASWVNLEAESEIAICIQ